MELREFISQSLSQIVNGIEDAHSKIEVKTNLPIILHVGQSRRDQFDQIEKIEFEVLVNAESGSTTSGGGKINVFSINAGLNTGKESKQSQLNRIKFAVPICFSKTKPAENRENDKK